MDENRLSAPDGLPSIRILETRRSGSRIITLLGDAAVNEGTLLWSFLNDQGDTLAAGYLSAGSPWNRTPFEMTLEVPSGGVRLVLQQEEMESENGVDSRLMLRLI